MFKKFILLTISFITIFTLTGCHKTSENQLSTKEKKEDFEYLYKTVEEGYPYLEVNKRLNNVDWLSKKDEYLKRVTDTKSDDKFIRAMTSVVFELNNKHTHLIKNKDDYDFVKDTYSSSNYFDFFDEKVVVDRYEKLDSTSSNSSSKFKSTNSSAIDNLILKDIINNEVGYMYIPQMLRDEDYLNTLDTYIDTLDNHKVLIIDIRGNGGGSDGCWMNIVSKLAKNDITSTGYMLFRDNSPVISDYLKNRQCTLAPMDRFPSKTLKNMPKETLDLFTGFAKVDKSFPKNTSSKFNGNIYLLVDNAVYSSSESFSIFCKDTNFATLIGETTAGDGGGMDPVLFYLKNSGLIVRMSSDMYLTANGTCNEEFKTTPDYDVKDCNRNNDFKSDNCIKKVLELENFQ